MERNSRESMPTFRDRKRAKDVASIADTLAHCMKLKMEGANDAVIELEMKRMLKSDKEPFDEPRYRCHVCLDNGVVCVWNPNDIDAIRDGRLQRGGIVHRAAMACNCSSGDRIYAAKVGPNSKGVQIARYHSQLHCIESRDPFEFAETSAAGKRGQVNKGVSVMSNVEIIISGNDAKIVQMFAKMKSEQDAVEKRFGKIKDASKKSADEVMKHWEGFGASLASIDGGMGNVVKNITAFAGGFVTAQAAAEVISARLDNIVAKQKEAGKLFTEIAPAQAGAALNLGTADPETVKQLLVDVVPKVATEADFPNIQALTKAIEDLASSGESNVQALEAALIAGAKLTREKPEAVGALSAAGIRVGRSAGLTDPESAISLVGSSQALTPIKDIANYAQNLGIVLQSSRIAMKDQPVGAVAQETTALFAALSQAGGKPTGEELTTFISPVISKLDALFEGRADDPKSLKGRIDALRNNPELRAEFMGDAPDSAVYSVPLNEMLTQGTELAKSLDDALGKITTDVSVIPANECQRWRRDAPTIPHEASKIRRGTN